MDDRKRQQNERTFEASEELPASTQPRRASLFQASVHLPALTSHLLRCQCRPLRELVRPYILRRLKTDKAVIADLPDKTEVKAFCSLTRAQAALYQRGVTELSTELAAADGITRKGVVLAFLMRFKQICNHPSQWLGDGTWAETDSGTLARLREIAEGIAAKQEKVLVVTQFREAAGPLAAFLGSVCGRPGLVLHGGTAVKTRQSLVRHFQQDEAVPFFVLSLKGGGELRLTEMKDDDLLRLVALDVHAVSQE